MSEPVVLITGVGGGIGTATAQRFKAQGWSVLGVDLTPPNADLGIDGFFQGDVAEADFWKDLTATLETQMTVIHGLVNNAAKQVCKPLLDTTLEEWDRVMAVNLRSVYLAVRHLYPLMRGVPGAIVNVSSVHALATSPGIAAYAASKGGLLALTRALALELVDDGIRVNAVLPGAVETPMLRAGLSRGHLSGDVVKEQMTALGTKHPMKRVGHPDEIAQAVYFLAEGTQSSFITGQSLVVDGGAIAHLSTE